MLILVNIIEFKPTIIENLQVPNLPLTLVINQPLRIRAKALKI